MAQSSVGRGPIPPAIHEDPEDVAWALSTAEAMYARGERSDALKWLRRAAEAAAENNTDGRAVQLAKAAADLAGLLAPPAVAPPASSRPALQPKKPPPPSAVPSPSRPGVAPSPPRVGPTGASAATVASVATGATGAASGAFRRAASTPALDDPTTEPAVAAPARARDSAPVIARAADVSIPDLLQDELADEPEEKTRIGVPAYQADAMAAAAETPEPPDAAEPSLRLSQALRVIVWRGPDGVRVAPQGTHVSAIAIDAVLVALDPSADLAAWLSKK
jgi:hypothetical protein